MPETPRHPSRLRSARAWIALGVLAPIGMLALSGMTLLDLRRDAYDRAEQTSNNLLQVIERDIVRNVEILDLSLRAVVDNLREPEVAALSPRLRRLVLFDRAATARDMGAMFVLDERGDIIVDEGAVPPRVGNYADREYFRAHQTRADLGLYIGQPLVSRLTGERTLPFSRRISRPDGSFGGVAYGSLKLTYFGRLFDRLALGSEGAINLYLRDGTRIARQPYVDADIGANIRGAATFERFVGARSGSFVGTSVRDGVERHYAFTQVGDLPLVLNVALATSEIEAPWRTKAMVVGGGTLVLCGLAVMLALLFGRELGRRATMEAELAALSRTDALTGLPNRRRFDEVFAQVWETARRTGRPVALLIVDADHFKRCNDRHGHAVGDAVLAGLARCLSASVRRPSDLVSRVGGEEFAVLLPDTDRAGALRVADAIHAGVRTLSVASSGIAAGSVTVSVGVAVGPSDAQTHPLDLYRGADAALYRSKAGGRDQTQCAPLIHDPGAAGRPVLRLVGA